MSALGKTGWFTGFSEVTQNPQGTKDLALSGTRECSIVKKEALAAPKHKSLAWGGFCLTWGGLSALLVTGTACEWLAEKPLCKAQDAIKFYRCYQRSGALCLYFQLFKFSYLKKKKLLTFRFNSIPGMHAGEGASVGV